MTEQQGSYAHVCLSGLVRRQKSKEDEIREALAAATPGKVLLFGESLISLMSDDIVGSRELARVYDPEYAVIFAHSHEWLQYLLAEVDSLRSQLKESWTQEEFDAKEEHWKGLIRYANSRAEKAEYDRKQAEQERDEAGKEVNRLRDFCKMLAGEEEMFQEGKYETEMTRLVQANTAMKEALELLAEQCGRRSESAAFLASQALWDTEKGRCSGKAQAYRNVRIELEHLLSAEARDIPLQDRLTAARAEVVRLEKIDAAQSLAWIEGRHKERDVRLGKAED